MNEDQAAVDSAAKCSPYYLESFLFRLCEPGIFESILDALSVPTPVTSHIILDEEEP